MGKKDIKKIRVVFALPDSHMTLEAFGIRRSSSDVVIENGVKYYESIYRLDASSVNYAHFLFRVKESPGLIGYAILGESSRRDSDSLPADWEGKLRTFRRNGE